MTPVVTVVVSLLQRQRQHTRAPLPCISLAWLGIQPSSGPAFFTCGWFAAGGLASKQQAPHRLRQNVGDALGIAHSKVRVSPCNERWFQYSGMTPTVGLQSLKYSDSFKQSCKYSEHPCLLTRGLQPSA